MIRHSLIYNVTPAKTTAFVYGISSLLFPVFMVARAVANSSELSGTYNGTLLFWQGYGQYQSNINISILKMYVIMLVT